MVPLNQTMNRPLGRMSLAHFAPLATDPIQLHAFRAGPLRLYTSTILVPSLMDGPDAVRAVRTPINPITSSPGRLHGIVVRMKHTVPRLVHGTGAVQAHHTRPRRIDSRPPYPQFKFMHESN